MKTITVQTTVNAPIEKVWECWNDAKHFAEWVFAAADWEVLAPENDLRVGGRLKVTMAAKDKSQSFDFILTYTAIKEHAVIESIMDDGRRVKVEFQKTPEGVKVIETFDSESENSEEAQRSGWQAIMNNFKTYVEGLASKGSGSQS